MELWAPTISAVIVAIIVSSAGLLLWRSQRRKNEAEAQKAKAEAQKAKAEAEKTDADAAGVLTDKALDMVRRWEGRVLELEATVVRQGKEIESLKCRVRKLEAENDNLLNGAIALTVQVREAGLEPDWQPA